MSDIILWIFDQDIMKYRINMKHNEKKKLRQAEDNIPLQTEVNLYFNSMFINLIFYVNCKRLQLKSRSFLIINFLVCSKTNFLHILRSPN